MNSAQRTHGTTVHATRRTILTALAVLVAGVAVSAGAHSANAQTVPHAAARHVQAAPDTQTAPHVQAAAYTLPTANAKFDYQIGAAYPPPSGVQVVSRDRNASPAAGLYTICYINAFQVQPDELAWWKANHDDLLLKKNGAYVIDTGWNENLIDVSTSAKRSAVAAIVDGWIDGCAAKGFKAIEPDNIDSYDRSKGLLTQQEAVAYLALLAPHAHGAGLAIAQKNTTELGTAGKGAGLDFAIAEECGRYGECGAYTSVYGNEVFDIEYTKSAFTKACKSNGATLSIVRRDVDVTAPGSGTYVYDAC